MLDANVTWNGVMEGWVSGVSRFFFGGGVSCFFLFCIIQVSKNLKCPARDLCFICDWKKKTDPRELRFVKEKHTFGVFCSPLTAQKSYAQVTVKKKPYFPLYLLCDVCQKNAICAFSQNDTR